MAHKAQIKGFPSKINPAQFPKEPSTAESASPHKGPIECAPHILKRSASSHKNINDVHLVHRNARSVPWAGEEALALIGGRDPTGHDIGLRTSKSSSSPEESDGRILRGYCGAKRIGDLGPFHIKPMAHAEKEEMSEDEHRKSRLPGYTVEDNPILGEL